MNRPIAYLSLLCVVACAGLPRAVAGQTMVCPAQDMFAHHTTRMQQIQDSLRICDAGISAETSLEEKANIRYRIFMLQNEYHMLIWQYRALCKKYCPEDRHALDRLKKENRPLIPTHINETYISSTLHAKD